VPLAGASAAAVLAHASSFVPITLLGFALFAMTGMRREKIGEIVKGSDEARKSESGIGNWE
jgi:hypothetical protein